MKVLLIDNYDSFTYNLFHYLSSLKCNVDVKRNDNARVDGNLTIHGKTNHIIVTGELINKQDIVNINADFLIKLEDYNIEVPSIMMYKIAEEIVIKVNIELKEIK